MTKFAAYGDDAVYGIGDTPEAALEDARDTTREPEVALLIARISDELAAEILEHGWSAYTESFDVRDGMLTRATDDEPEGEPEGPGDEGGPRLLSATQLRDWIDAMGWYDNEAAKRLGCSRRALGHWLAGRSKIPLYIGLAAAALARDLPPWPRP